MKKILLASTSTLFGEPYLAYLLPHLDQFFKGVETLTFIPYARPGGTSHDDYTGTVAKAFAQIGIKVVGLHTFNDPKEGLDKAEAIFVGGGNTFLLVDQLYRQELMQPLKYKIEKGTPYLGTSAGSNIAGVSMKTTNDMPIVYPPSFETLGVVPFNINPHYLDPDPDSHHNGETRETRISEFHCFNDTPVIGLREGSFIAVGKNRALLHGPHTARVFMSGKQPFEMEPDSNVMAGIK